jgi:nitrous oxidase accessory protein NosD
MKKIPICTLIFLVFISISYIEDVKAIGTVYIRSDGSIEGAGLIFSNDVYWFTGDVYGQIVVEKDGVTIEGSGYVLHGMNEGSIILQNRSGVALRNISVVDAPFGVNILGGRNNEITLSNCSAHLENTSGNSIYLNKQISLLFSNASKTIVFKNNITDSSTYGMKFQKFSKENIIFKNNITDNRSGIEFHGESNNNTVHENNIMHNSDGMIFYSSFNNSIYDNVIAFNSNSPIYFRGGSNNRFFRNDFVENNDPMICWYSSNVWDNGSEGNYWSDYNGTDIDSDGIGDSSYSILTLHFTGESYDYDNYPLMEPIIIPELTSWIIIPLSIMSTLFVIILKKRF